MTLAEIESFPALINAPLVHRVGQFVVEPRIAASPMSLTGCLPCLRKGDRTSLRIRAGGDT